MWLSRSIQRALPPSPVLLSEVVAESTVLVLVPVGEGNEFVLPDLRAALAKRLGIKVVIASCEMQIPKADRSEKDQWVRRMREQVNKTIAQQPAAIQQVEELGYTADQLRTDVDALVGFFRKTVERQQGADGVRAFDEMIALSERSRQWDAEKLLPALRTAIANATGPKRLILGVTDCDLYSKTSNYLFGIAETGGFLGLASSHRFRAIFNDEAPKRERLIERLLKQSLSSFGSMLGVPRCNTPECARAYPKSLVEHDQKPHTLCPECRERIGKVLGQKLPSD